MAAVITVRNLSEETQRFLRHKAVDHGRSMEAEIRAILEDAARTPDSPAEEPVLFAAARQFRVTLADEGIEFAGPERITEYPREVVFE